MEPPHRRPRRERYAGPTVPLGVRLRRDPFAHRTRPERGATSPRMREDAPLPRAESLEPGRDPLQPDARRHRCEGAGSRGVRRRGQRVGMAATRGAPDRTGRRVRSAPCGEPPGRFPPLNGYGLRPRRRDRGQAVVRRGPLSERLAAFGPQESVPSPALEKPEGHQGVPGTEAVEVQMLGGGESPPGCAGCAGLPAVIPPGSGSCTRATMRTMPWRSGGSCRKAAPGSSWETGSPSPRHAR